MHTFFLSAASAIIHSSTTLSIPLNSPIIPLLTNTLLTILKTLQNSAPRHKDAPRPYSALSPISSNHHMYSTPPSSPTPQITPQYLYSPKPNSSLICTQKLATGLQSVLTSAFKISLGPYLAVRRLTTPKIPHTAVLVRNDGAGGDVPGST